MILTAWREGFRRVFAAPAVLAAVFVCTFVAAVPLALTLRETLRGHLGSSLAGDLAADAVNYDWWQEFTSQATGLGATFTPSILGFASTLDSLSTILDGRYPWAVAGALSAYVLTWAFLSGGILDRYARQRRTRAHGFFAACGVFFFRFLRLGLVAALLYYVLFTYVHDWIFTDWYTRATRALAVERTAFFWRAGMYLLFGALLLAVNVVMDYAKIRAVVEDRRSMLGALSAACRFIARVPARALGLYTLNALTFLALLAIWAVTAPEAAGTGLSVWVGFAGAQLYLAARLVLKLQFLASQTALFQTSLAHARYAAAPAPVWPESPAAEGIGSQADLKVEGRRT